jgi:hypothetical protein
VGAGGGGTQAEKRKQKEIKLTAKFFRMDSPAY